MNHFNWFQLMAPHDLVHVVTAFLATLVLLVFAFWGRLSLGTGERAYIPVKRFSLRGFFEVFIEGIADLVEKVMGKENVKLTPLFASIFLFIFFQNLVGLIPGMTPATDNLNTTLAFGVFSFFFIITLASRSMDLSI